jgi:hypothetical protein
MKVVTVVFDYAGDNYERLLRVFVGSLKQYTGLDAEVIRIKAPTIGRDKSFTSNTVKLKKWVEYLSKCKEGEQVVFCDCDMLVLKPFDDAFNHDFDIAYTYRSKGIPLNGGVVFVRNNKHSRGAVKQWKNINDRMMADPGSHEPYRVRYSGINQSAFGCLLESEPDADIIGLPCDIYNACDDTWKNLNPDVRMIHYKSGLRKAAIGLKPVPEFDALSILWREHEKRYIDM